MRRESAVNHSSSLRNLPTGSVSTCGENWSTTNSGGGSKERTIVTGGVHDARPTDKAVSVLALRAARSRTLATQTVLLTPEDGQKNFT